MTAFEKIGKYQITGKLGQGSFGVVYQGRDAYLKRDVAIKVCSVADEGLRKRFFREAEISGKLVHKNIVTVYEFGFEADVPYLVQEMLSGEDLSRIVKRREPIAPADKLDYLLQVANGLGYAHVEGVIHRDIKPANIRVLEGGQIKIMDFGIAKLASAETQLTQKGVTMGTASYLPPEQVRGGELDRRADIFSFGVLAYELMTFERPFRGNTLSALIYQILYKVPSPMSEVWPECPPPLSELIAKCLEKKPERRHGSFAELIPELAAIRSDVLAGTWPALQEVAVAPEAGQPALEPSDVVSQAALAESARGVLEGRVGDYTISTAAPRKSESKGAGRSTRPIAAPLWAAPAPVDDETAKTRILATSPADLGRPQRRRPATEAPAEGSAGEDSEELTLKAHEIIDLVAQGKLEAEAAKEQLEATLGKRDLTAVSTLTDSEVSLVKASRRENTETPAPADMPPEAVGRTLDGARSDTYRTLFKTPFRRLKWAGIAAASVVAASLGWLLVRPGDKPASEPVEAPAPTPITQPAVSEPATGAVTVDSAPWARITEITDAQGFVQELPQIASTPLFLKLPPGRYQIQLQNPEGTEVQTCEVDVTLETVSTCRPVFARPSVTEYFKETGWWF